jgi:CheY-like chemotaxis protein
MSKILIVDDHPDAREVLGQMLELHGLTVDFAESGEFAWEGILQSPPDAIIIDQRLPGLSGMDLLKKIRETPTLSKLLVVLCSGDDFERDAAQSAGAWDFWLKGSDDIFEGVAKLTERLRAE